jgi:hypothetical protein
VTRVIKGRKAPVAKAGKRKPAKSEEEAIRDAVANHGANGVTKRKRVKSYHYKAVDKSPAAPKLDLEHQLREPKGASEFELFLAELEDDEKPFGRHLFQMDCAHANCEKVASLGRWSDDTEEIWHVCKRCGYILRGCTKTAQRTNEWMSYCPVGFDMFDWQELYQSDKSLWRYIFDEAQDELVSSVLAGEG